jgi:hypothetical protein
VNKKQSADGGRSAIDREKSTADDILFTRSPDHPITGSPDGGWLANGMTGTLKIAVRTHSKVQRTGLPRRNADG